MQSRSERFARGEEPGAWIKNGLYPSSPGVRAPTAPARRTVRQSHLTGTTARARTKARPVPLPADRTHQFRTRFFWSHSDCTVHDPEARGQSVNSPRVGRNPSNRPLKRKGPHQRRSTVPPQGHEPAFRAAASESPTENTAASRRTADRKSTRLNSSHLGISYAVF